MNKAELITSIESRLGGKKAATDAVEAVLDAIIREVARGNKVGITGFGTFEKVTRAARTGRNPRTGETVPIKRTSVPKFKAGTNFKAVVAKPSSLPKTGNAGGRTATKAAAGTTAKKATTKTAAKKSTAKKATPAKSTAKKATVKSTVKKATPAKSAAKKTVAKKTTPAKSAAKTTAKKTTAKKSTARRTAKKA
ncbi:HU family DNA-binding protein [Calidifontibacter sp. DB0510]|uniref:HU family DNA-binding protein n=1 Tax=Metallococcus carri TaxID=1656884 RepID=A0A967E8S1_9MICO|nr:HU family DNA-binding protein [Metallococcus carri]NOP36681.1 HU family DNA-binding protein [Calidifontibacter sp. DB2511S]